MLKGKGNILLKTTSDIQKMREGGKKLAKVKKSLKETIKEGASAIQIEQLAEKLINSEGGKASFKMVSGYSWATCVNINEGVVHGIPKESIVFKKNDIVSVDVGLYYKDFHTDTSFSVGIKVNKTNKHFLELGEKALKKAISRAIVGNRIYDISEAIESVLEKGKVSPIRALVGHGVGKDLHEQPQIPCFTSGDRSKTPEIKKGMTMAIEIMYAKGNPKLKLDTDGWTISTADGTISALFEETIAVTKSGSVILTN